MESGTIFVRNSLSTYPQSIIPSTLASRTSFMSQHLHYDVLIVGAGIASSALAHALSTIPRPNDELLRIALASRVNI